MTRELRNIVKIDEQLCDGCGVCVPGCAEGAIEIRDGKARLVAEKLCDGLGACLGQCPKDAITVIQREAEAFDEDAVEERLRQQEGKVQIEPAANLGCGCPGSAMTTFAPARKVPAVQTGAASVSALTHWPLKIRLIPPHAPFLKGADLLVAADCAPAAYPSLHRDLLPGKVIMLGCPKFDDVQDYVQRFAELFRQADINSITVMSMEVPCCAGLAQIVRQAMFMSGSRIPFHEIKISRQGDILPEAGDATQPEGEALVNLH